MAKNKNRPKQQMKLKARRQRRAERQERLRPADGPRKRGGGGKRGRGRRKPKPYDPLAPLNRRQIRREVNTLADLQYGPVERQLGQEQRGLQQGSQNLDRWYQDYLNTVAQAGQATQQGYLAAQQAAYQQGQQQFQTQMGQIGNIQAQEAARLAPTGGQPAPENMQMATTAAQNLQGQATAGGNLIGQQGASANQFMQGQQIAARQQQLQAQTDQSARIKALEQELRSLSREKGQYRTKARSELRESEATKMLSRKAFGLDVAKQKEERRQAKAQEKQDLREFRHQKGKARWDKRKTQREWKQWEREFGADRADEKFKRKLDKEGLKIDWKKVELDEREAKRKAREKERDKKLDETTPSGGTRGENMDLWRGIYRRAKNNIDPTPSQREHGLLMQAGKEMRKSGFRGVPPSLARRIKKRYGITVKTYTTGPGERIQAPGPSGEMRPG